MISRPKSIGRGIVLLALAVLGGGVAAAQAIVQSLAKASPDLVLSLAPAHGPTIDRRYRASLDELAAGTSKSAGWANLARASLRAAPLSPAMIRIIAADPAEAARSSGLMHLAERVSRRDALTQLSLIETAVQEGRIDLALTHYDRALSIYPDLGPILFPVLGGAIDGEDIRHGVAAVARQRRPWINNFLQYAIRAAKPAAVASLLAELDHGPGALAAARQHEAALVGRLIEQGNYPAARTVAARALGENAGTLDRFGFTPETWQNAVRPLSWTEGEIEGVDTMLQPDGSVAVSASPGIAGLAMFRVAILPAGTYRFAVTTSADPELAAAGGHWTLLCLSGTGQPTRKIAGVDSHAQRLGPVATMIEVPQQCSAVRIDFVVDNSDGSTNAGMVLRDFTLARQR